MGRWSTKYFDDDAALDFANAIQKKRSAEAVLRVILDAFVNYANFEERRKNGKNQYHFSKKTIAEMRAQSDIYSEDMIEEYLKPQVDPGIDEAIDGMTACMFLLSARDDDWGGFPKKVLTESVRALKPGRAEFELTKEFLIKLEQNIKYFPEELRPFKKQIAAVRSAIG